MSADIFAAGLDREIDAFFEGAEVKRRRPGVVQHHQRAARMRGRGDRRHVLHLERQRAGRFHIDRARIGPHQFGNSGADGRIVIRGLDAKPSEHAVAEFPRRQIDGIGHQQMVAGAAHRQQRGRDRSEPGGKQCDARALRPLDRHQRIAEGFGGWGAAAAVKIAAAMGDIVFRGGKQDGRGVIDRRIDEAMVRERIAPAGHELGRGLVRWEWGPALGILGHACIRRAGAGSLEEPGPSLSIARASLGVAGAPPSALRIVTALRTRSALFAANTPLSV